jgi:hypothetical protein
MSDRIIIGLDPGASPQSIISRLLEIGAKQVQPIEGIPDALIADVDENRSDAFIRRALQLPGIRHAEHDQLRSTY